MKKTLIYALFSLTLLLNASLVYGYSELNLKTDIHWISNEQIKTRAHHFRSFFQSPLTPADSFNAVCDITNYTTLKNMQVHLNHEAVENNNLRHFHVLRIYYGMDIVRDAQGNVTSNKIVLIYIPDIAVELVKDSRKFSYFYDDLLADNPKVFVSGDLVNPIRYNDAVVQQYISNYYDARNILVNRYGVPGVRGVPLNLCPATGACQGDATYDANGMVFPFQELEDFYEDATSQDVYIVNVAEIDDKHGLNFYKHGIAFTNYALGTNQSEAISANLGGLCPPKCNEITLRRIKIKGIWHYILNPSFYGKEYSYVGLIMIAMGGLLGLIVLQVYRYFVIVRKK